jgi:hypothetical protein
MEKKQMAICCDKRTVQDVSTKVRKENKVNVKIQALENLIFILEEAC